MWTWQVTHHLAAVWLPSLLVVLERAVALGELDPYIEGTFQNPVVGVNAPDPAVQRLEGEFYMVTRGNAVEGFGFPIRRSGDLVRWKKLGPALPDSGLPKWARGKTLRSPSLHSVSGRYHLYFAAKPKWGYRFFIGLAVANHPHGPFKALDRPLGPVGVAPMFFRDPGSGAQYLIWCGGPRGGIRARQLNAAGTTFAGSSTMMVLFKHDPPWRRVATAPWMVKHEGEYFLFFSSWAFRNLEESIGVARAPSIKGPYQKSGAPVLSQPVPDPRGQVRKWGGPGNCAVVQTETGWAMVYHALQVNHTRAAPDRMVLVDRLHWGPGGWPIVGASGSPTRGKQPPFSASAPAAGILLVGASYIFRAVEFLGRGVGPDGRISSEPEAFRVSIGRVPGGTVSLESTRRPGTFLRHSFGGRLEVAAPDGTHFFDRTASFCALPGLLTGSLESVSLRSIYWPGMFVVHSRGHLELAHIASGSLFMTHATWAFEAVRGGEREAPQVV